MRHLVFPKESGLFAPEDNGGPVPTVEVSLGGYFYDHICNSAEAIVGVRYWVDESIVFDRHPVFRQFMGDERFKFNQRDHYVDIVFDERNVDPFRNGTLSVQTVQDFGGDAVVKHGNAFGISFSL